MMISRRKMMILLGAWIVGSFVSSPALGRRRRVRLRRRGLSGYGGYSGPALSRDQLRECITFQDQINAQAERVDAQEVALKTELQHLEKLADQIDKKRLTVDRYDKKSVDSYNSLVSRHRKLVEQYNAELPAHNAAVQQVNQKMASFNSTCADHAYYETDMKAVVAERSTRK